MKPTTRFYTGHDAHGIPRAAVSLAQVKRNRALHKQTEEFLDFWHIVGLSLWNVDTACDALYL